MGMIIHEAAQRARTRRKMEEMRRAFRLRGDGGLRCEPMVSGNRDPMGPRTDAPAKGVRRWSR